MTSVLADVTVVIEPPKQISVEVVEKIELPPVVIEIPGIQGAQGKDGAPGRDGKDAQVQFLTNYDIDSLFK